MKPPQTRPRHTHRITRHELLQAGRTACVTLSTWPFIIPRHSGLGEVRQPKRGGIRVGLDWGASSPVWV